MNHSRVFDWHCHFKERRISVKSDECQGGFRPEKDAEKAEKVQSLVNAKIQKKKKSSPVENDI